MLEQLDSMRARYPNLISMKAPISNINSHENRPIFGVKISDNPEVDETTEPEALYTAIHHAREPGSMSQVIYYMWFLLENYSTDSSIKALVDQTQLYFVPCLNPDGYIFNQTSFPDGGGMWRKNRRVNSPNVFGVDLNRNYGQFWGFDDEGSSPDQERDTYRGPNAFSEPETRAIKAFCEARRFRFALNYHTYSNLLIYPWGYSGLLTTDSQKFINYGKLLTRENEYRYGTGMETLGYNSNGSSDDWMYGETGTKPKIFSFTPECGSWFWETEEEIIPLCESALEQNISLAKLLLPFAQVVDLSQEVYSTSQVFFKYKIQNLSAVASNFRLRIRPLAGVTTSLPDKNYQFNSESSITDSIRLNLSSNVRSGDVIGWVSELYNGYFTQKDTIWKVYGITSVRFSDEFTSNSNWLGRWQVNTIQGWITDSPNGTYQPADSSYSETQNQIDLRNTNFAWLNFDIRFEIEELYDFGQVLASTDSGATWIALCGKLTRPAVPFSLRSLNSAPIYDGIRANWRKEIIDLRDLTGKKIMLRLSLVSDGFAEEDGIFIKNMKIIAVETPTQVMASSYQKEEIFIYPNPTSSLISIQSLSPIRHLKITDQHGKLIVVDHKIDQKSVNTTYWPHGLYILHAILENGQTVNKKFSVLRP